MKIGILTRRYGHNMGSTLQAFAIAELMKTYSSSVEIIDYDETAQHLKWRLRPILDHTLFYIRWLLPKSKREYLVHRHKQEQRFSQFEFNNLPLTSRKYLSSKSLKSKAQKYDRIVVGSDQIWSPFLYDSNYFGVFLSKDDKEKLVPYAPSLGTSNFTNILPQQKELIQELPFLSCREEAGSEILKKISGRNVPVVLDPTLMIPLNLWNNLAEMYTLNNLPERYILTYFLGQNIPHAEIKKLSQQFDSKVVNINMFNRPNSINPDIDMKDIGPGEFLYLLKNASYILTDSFHATIFSWIFNREFTVFERFKASEKQNQNSRIYTLLTVLGCQDRLHGVRELRQNPCRIEEYKKMSSHYLDSVML